MRIHQNLVKKTSSSLVSFSTLNAASFQFWHDSELVNTEWRIPYKYDTTEKKALSILNSKLRSPFFIFHWSIRPKRNFSTIQPFKPKMKFFGSFHPQKFHFWGKNKFLGWNGVSGISWKQKVSLTLVQLVRVCYYKLQ